MKLLYLPLLIILYAIPAFTGPIEKVAELIRRGDVSELSKMFAADMELSIPNDENVYSKVQAGIILDKFFSQNKPLSVKMLHKVNSNPNYVFAVLILTTDKGSFRIAYTLKENGGNLMLIELRIETEKMK